LRTLGSIVLVRNHSSFNSCLAVARFEESMLKILLRKFLTALLISLGTSYLAFWIFLKRSASNSPKKGSFPVKRIKEMTPRAHTSAAYPLYSFFLTMSGSMYWGVPQKRASLCSGEAMTLNPKSMSFTFLASSMRILSNLRSLWTTLFSWR